MTDLQRSILAALGYIHLKMFQDAWDELEGLSPEDKAYDEVLEIRIEIFLHLKKWTSARELAESLARRTPEDPGCLEERWTMPKW